MVSLYSFSNLGASWGGWWTPRPGRFTPWKETRYPLYRRLGGPQVRPGLVQKTSSRTGIRSPDRSSCSGSLSFALGRENNRKGYNTGMRGYAEYEIINLMISKAWILNTIVVETLNLAQQKDVVFSMGLNKVSGQPWQGHCACVIKRCFNNNGESFLGAVGKPFVTGHGVGFLLPSNGVIGCSSLERIMFMWQGLAARVLRARNNYNIGCARYLCTLLINTLSSSVGKSVDREAWKDLTGNAYDWFTSTSSTAAALKWKYIWLHSCLKFVKGFIQF